MGWGAYVPYYRITAEEIAKVWGQDGEAVKRGLMIKEKSVPGPDEDAATIAVEASRNALRRAEINPQDIGAIYVGSESHPYAVKPTATIVAEAIRATPDLTAADMEFACKAGTAAVQACIGLVKSGIIKYGLACGADTSQGAPGGALEFTAAAGGATMIVGKEKPIAEFQGTYSFTTDTPDFWRREGEPYPRHGGRFTGQPAYFKHVVSAASTMMDQLGIEPKDITYFVPHQPNGKFPRAAAKKLGFTPEQVEPSILVQDIGNTYSGASMLGLAHVLDFAKPNDTILVTSYGSGAGSDSFVLKVTDRITKVQKNARQVQDYVDHKHNINYATYAKYRGKILEAE